MVEYANLREDMVPFESLRVCVVLLLYAHMRQRENVSPVTGTQHQRKKIAPIPPFHCTCACVLARTNKRRNAFAPNLIHLSLSCTLSLFLPTPPLLCVCGVLLLRHSIIPFIYHHERLYCCNQYTAYA